MTTTTRTTETFLVYGNEIFEGECKTMRGARSMARKLERLGFVATVRRWLLNGACEQVEWHTANDGKAWA